MVEPRHDKTNKMSVRSAKTQISLGIHPIWSESSLCAQWVAKETSFLHTDSEAHTHFVGFVVSRLLFIHSSKKSHNEDLKHLCIDKQLCNTHTNIKCIFLYIKQH